MLGELGLCGEHPQGCAREALSSNHRDSEVPTGPGGDCGAVSGGSARSTRPSSAHLRWRSAHSRAVLPGHPSRRGPRCRIDRALCPARTPPACPPPGAAPRTCRAAAGPSCVGRTRWDTLRESRMLAARSRAQLGVQGPAYRPPLQGPKCLVEDTRIRPQMTCTGRGVWFTSSADTL